MTKFEEFKEWYKLHPLVCDLWSYKENTYRPLETAPNVVEYSKQDIVIHVPVSNGTLDSPSARKQLFDWILELQNSFHKTFSMDFTQNWVYIKSLSNADLIDKGPFPLYIKTLGEWKQL